MKGETNYENLMSAAETISKLDAKLNKAEAQQLINQAIRESQQYTDLKIRKAARESRREEKMIRKSQMTASISTILLILGILIVYFCESTIKAPNFNGNKIVFLIAIIGASLLFISLVLLLVSSVIPGDFYKIKYTIRYRYRGPSNEIIYDDYITKATTATKAISRYYRIVGLQYTPFDIIDEFGNHYNAKGEFLEDK